MVALFGDHLTSFRSCAQGPLRHLAHEVVVIFHPLEQVTVLDRRNVEVQPPFLLLGLDLFAKISLWILVHVGWAPCDIGSCGLLWRIWLSACVWCSSRKLYVQFSTIQNVYFIRRSTLKLLNIQQTTLIKFINVVVPICFLGRLGNWGCWWARA